MAWDINEKMTLADMVKVGIDAKTFCTACDGGQLVDIPALIEKVGPDYKLYNKRTRCRMTEGCAGFNRFWCNRGAVFLPMWDDDTAEVWLRRDSNAAIRS